MLLLSWTCKQSHVVQEVVCLQVDDMRETPSEEWT